MDLIPEPAPNVRQLLAFYLEAGVDCALMDEPVNRLADPDAAPPPRETVVREAPPKTFFQAGRRRRASCGKRPPRRRQFRAAK